MMMMSFVLRTTTTTSAPQNSVVVVYVSHHHRHLHRGVVTDDEIVVGVVKLVVVAGNNTQRKQRSPLNRWSFSLLLFYSFLFFFLTLLLFCARFSSLFIHFDERCVFCEQKNIFLFDSRQTRKFFSLSLFIFFIINFFTQSTYGTNYAHKQQQQQKRIDY